MINTDFSYNIKPTLNTTNNNQKEDFSAIFDEVQKFKSELNELGASGYLAKLNAQKLQDKLDKKRAELEASYDIKNLQGEEKAKAILAIEEILQAYKKQLLDEMQAASKLEAQAKKMQNNSVLFN